MDFHLVFTRIQELEIVTFRLIVFPFYKVMGPYPSKMFFPTLTAAI